LVEEIAKSSGGFSGFGAVNSEEKEMLSKIKTIFFSPGIANNIKKAEEKAQIKLAKINNDKSLNQSSDAKPRVKERFNIKNVVVQVKIEKEILKAKLININQTSLLCRIDFSERQADLLKSTEISMEFPQEFGKTSIKSSKCHLVRIQADNWDAHFKPKFVKVVWHFANLSEFNQNALSQILNQLSDNK